VASEEEPVRLVEPAVQSLDPRELCERFGSPGVVCLLAQCGSNRASIACAGSGTSPISTQQSGDCAPKRRRRLRERVTSRTPEFSSNAGRVLRLSGDLEAALPLFEAAYEAALAAGQDFIAGDAAHMAALAGDMIAWTQRGLEVAQRSPAAAHWVGPLLNNLGWWHAQRGEQAESLAAYRGSLEAYERDARYPYLWEAARVGVARALRALGRAKEALPLLEQAVASAEAAGHPDRAFHEELAAAYADLGRTEEAAEQERLSALAGPGPFALWQARPRPPRSDPGS
jgi:tetratricopeptide (TPR) repeat protein